MLPGATKQVSYNTLFKDDLNNVNFEMESVSDISEEDLEGDGDDRTLDLDQLSPLSEQDESNSSKTKEDSQSPVKTEFINNPRFEFHTKAHRK